MKRKYNENRKFSMKDENFKKALREYIELIDNNQKTKTVNIRKIIEFYKKGKVYEFLLGCTIPVLYRMRYDSDIYHDMLEDDEMCNIVYNIVHADDIKVTNVIYQEIINEKSI